MISELMLYGAKVALLISMAALALEQPAAWRGYARRGLWFAAMVLSLTLPALGVLGGAKQTTAPASLATGEPTPPVLYARPLGGAVRTDRTQSPAIHSYPPQSRVISLDRGQVESVLLIAWLTASGLLLMFYALGWLRLRIAARRWRREWIDNQPVWVTESLGPAVYGFIRPKILIPSWVCDSSMRLRSLVLAHEQEHIVAADPVLLVLGLIMVTVAPWNVLLWWQLRRLRFAIEVDCDARVIGRGAEVAAYGEVLLAVGKQRTVMPVGAIALTELPSQLLQRIRIMTAPAAKPRNFAMAAAVGLSVASFAMAAEFRAPALLVHSADRNGTAPALLKLPLGENPRDIHLRSLVRAAYPELFGASAPANPVLVTLVVDQDGTLLKSFKEDIEPTPWIPTSLTAFDAMGIDYRDDWSAKLKLRMEGSPAKRNRVDVRAWYREPPPDPTRDVATVHAKVRAQYGSLFRPIYADGSRVFRDGTSLVTVFMTESGDIERAQAEVSKGMEVDKDVDTELATLATPERFVQMGVASERIGPIGTTSVFSGHYLRERDSKTILVIYAWPRRPNEPGAKHVVSEQPATAGANDEPGADRAIAERYFPDLYTHSKAWPRPDPWVLLDRRGRVLKTGRQVVMSGRDIRLYVESLYPGIRTDEVQVTTVHGDIGQSADVGFVWLAANSPITAHALTARIRVQHAPLRATGEIPDASETGWSADAADVRAQYGEATEVRVTDQNGENWKIVLHPERLGPGRG